MAKRLRHSARNSPHHLTPELRSLVSRSVAILGEVIQRELGAIAFKRIERIRRQMAALREQTAKGAYTRLRGTFQELETLSARERVDFANSYTLMLELMNACENAYRSYRLSLRKTPRPEIKNHDKNKPNAIIYVLTAHPTEARAPQNIAIFHQIQDVLVRILNSKINGEELSLSTLDEENLRHLLEIAWRAPLVRSRKPRVKDEAEHIYSTALRDGILNTLLTIGEKTSPFYFRSWVGGDKDGHPGVDEKVLLQSLSLSRTHLLRHSLSLLQEVRSTLELFPSTTLHAKASRATDKLKKLRSIATSDAKKIRAAREALILFGKEYREVVGVLHPCLRSLRQIFRTFPALVIPLELREASDVLMASQKKKPKPAIERMLAAIERLSRGGDPRWYARGFIISMTEAIEHIRAAAAMQIRVFGSARLPIIPLFEQAEALANSEKIVNEMLSDRKLKSAISQHWERMLEIMVGYSDSSKESGVLPSRLKIAEMLPRLEKVCLRKGVTPVFFHGSGGSIDRGGGSIEDQTAWWPKAALRRYKVTVQGEMVERALATPEIAKRTIEQIVESASRGLQGRAPLESSRTLDVFAQRIALSYRAQIQSPTFLELVERATPYPYLNLLKIGSRPSKRSKQLTVSGLRAIPWILCWTQTRVLFPTWWGVGSAWTTSSTQEKRALKKAFATHPVFTSYVKALGFTLAKVELPVWRMYLEHSRLSNEQVHGAYELFENELQKTLIFFREVTGQNELLWFRPWLGESIRLRSPMIHPLNLLQILAERDKDFHLLRICVTGISSGMLTTG